MSGAELLIFFFIETPKKTSKGTRSGVFGGVVSVEGTSQLLYVTGECCTHTLNTHTHAAAASHSSPPTRGLTHSLTIYSQVCGENSHGEVAGGNTCLARALWRLIWSLEKKKRKKEGQVEKGWGGGVTEQRRERPAHRFIHPIGAQRHEKTQQRSRGAFSFSFHYVGFLKG